jgi:diadenylate cyclase
MRWRDFIDIFVVTLLFWGALVWLRRTRALFAFLGLAILATIYLAARQLGLELAAWIFQGFSAVFLILIVVVFQEDLRRLLEQIGAWGMGLRGLAPTQDIADLVVRVAATLAQNRTGAILVLPGQEPVDRHLKGGLVLDGRLSEALLLSIFDHHSPGHDGAVVISGDRVTRFGVHLPLSVDHRQIGAGGTRHAAALGLSERVDALCIVVSEERGTVSVARRGKVEVLNSPKELAGILRDFEEETSLRPESPAHWRRIMAGWPYFLLAACFSTALWFLLVPGSTVVEAQREARVVVDNLPNGYVLESVDPEEVSVILSGPRREIFFGPPDMVKVRVDALLAQLGRRTFSLTPEMVEHPQGIEVMGVTPNQVKIALRKAPEAKPAR